MSKLFETPLRSSRRSLDPSALTHTPSSTSGKRKSQFGSNLANFSTPKAIKRDTNRNSSLLDESGYTSYDILVTNLSNFIFSTDSVKEAVEWFITFLHDLDYKTFSFAKILHLDKIMKSESIDLSLLILIIFAKMMNAGNQPSAEQRRQALAIINSIKKSNDDFTLFDETKENPYELLIDVNDIISLKNKKIEFDFDSIVPKLDLKSKSVEGFSPSSSTPKKIGSPLRRKSSGVRSLSNFCDDNDTGERIRELSPKLVKSPKKRLYKRRFTRDEVIDIIKKNEMFELKKSGKIALFLAEQEEADMYNNICNKFFKKWDTAYQGVMLIWNKFETDDDFYLPCIIALLRNSFYSFAVVGLRSLSLRK